MSTAPWFLPLTIQHQTLSLGSCTSLPLIQRCKAGWGEKFMKLVRKGISTTISLWRYRWWMLSFERLCGCRYRCICDCPFVIALTHSIINRHAPVVTQPRVYVNHFLLAVLLITYKWCHRTQQDIVLPLSTPVKSSDGKRIMHEIYLKKDTNVIIGAGNANRDPAIWGDDADEWRPERWMGQEREITKERLPGVYSGT